MVREGRGTRYPGDGDGSHEEWLLDDAIDDTFPASDPVSHGQPGSIINLRYAARRRMVQPAQPRNVGAPGWLLLAGAAVACALLLMRRRRRRDDALHRRHS